MISISGLKLIIMRIINLLLFTALRQHDFRPIELDLFVGDKWLVSFHKEEINELSEVWEHLCNNPSLQRKSIFPYASINRYNGR